MQGHAKVMQEPEYFQTALKILKTIDHWILFEKN